MEKFDMLMFMLWYFTNSLQWRHNESDGVSNHLRLDCLLNRSGADQRKHPLWGAWVPLPKGPIIQNTFPWYDAIIYIDICYCNRVWSVLHWNGNVILTNFRRLPHITSGEGINDSFIKITFAFQRIVIFITYHWHYNFRKPFSCYTSPRAFLPLALV